MVMLKQYSGEKTPVRVDHTQRTWLISQATNLSRHLEALRPFEAGEFGDTPAAPTQGHLQAANALILELRRKLATFVAQMETRVNTALRHPTTETLQEVVWCKHIAHEWVQATEQIWDFYFELFGQRQSQAGECLLGCDRIALDCYQHTFLGLGVAKSIPAPAPFSYMRTGFSPATFRRGIPLRKLARRLNPFPLVKLPYHRLVNPWTLGAILHEVSHNLQNELGLEHIIPLHLKSRLVNSGFHPAVANVWSRWNREIYADLSAILLGGPAVVSSLMDVVGRDVETVLYFDPNGVHPTPYLRTLISIELLRRMGFNEDAARAKRVWTELYPDPRRGSMPPILLKNFPEAIAHVVDVICFTSYKTLGNKPLADVIRFAPKEQQMVEEAARRLARGRDPGVVPERFLIGASRFALEHRLADPDTITRNVYKELARR